MEPGAHIGPYRVVGQLGEGGMARVYAAKGPAGELRAIKVLAVPGAAARERFSREALVQQRVLHEHTLPLIELLPVPGGLALVLPLVEGPSLAALLERPTPTGQRLALFRQVVQGVAAIHQAGVVHRDLKPQNVLLQPEAQSVRARVADFGLAKPVGSGKLTRTGAELGTPAYMAPEQRVDASRIDTRADVWALGAMLCEMLGGSVGPLGAWLPAASPRAWAELAERLTQPDPAQRPQDATQVLALLPETEPVSSELYALCLALAPVPGPLAPEAEQDGLGGNLSRERDRFVGREAELVELAASLDQGVRLLTLIGADGVGRSRLARHYAQLCHEDWPGGVWFCGVAGVQGAAELASAVARAMEVPLGGDAVEQVGRALAARGPCLLILDDLEPSAAPTLQRWLVRTELAQFLAIGRPLDLAGERVMTLSPPLPSDAVELFEARVEGAPGPRVGELVERLGGLPLALELCATRAGRLSISEILAGLPADPPADPLQAVLQWSWSLLSPCERAALVQLSVFRGGFGLPAAEAVLELPEPDAWALDVVDALVSHGLLRVGPGRRTEVTPALLALVQARDPEQVQAAFVRHGRYFAELERQGDVRELVPELRNLAAACRRAIARGDGEVAAGALSVLGEALELQGPLELGLELAREIEAMAGLSPQARAELDAAHAWLLTLSGHFEQALILGERALSSSRALGRHGLALQSAGRTAEARGYYERALQPRSSPGALEATLRSQLGSLLMALGQGEEAAAELQRALELQRSSGDRRGLARTLEARATLAEQSGRTEEAQRDLTTALELHRELGDALSETQTLSQRGQLYLQQGQLPEARADLQAALAAHLRLGLPVPQSLLSVAARI